MTTPVAIPQNAMPLDSTLSPTTPAKKISFPLLWLSSLFILFHPAPIGRYWTRASFRQAIIVGLSQSLLAFAWLFIVVAAYNFCIAVPIPSSQPTADGRFLATRQSISFRQATTTLGSQLADNWKEARITEKLAAIVGTLFFWAGALLLPFFVLLPFATRPGSNRACALHVARTVLLGSGILPLWTAAFTTFFLIFPSVGPHSNGPAVDPTDIVAPLLCLFTALGLWSLLALITVVRQEYRQPTNFPQPHDPYCDQCGYILIAADAAGRCPECGRLVSDSLGSHTRPPTAWERRPTYYNLPAILSQLKSLLLRPRDLFFTMPTLTGQRAAQHWLIGAVCIVALLAAAIVPAIRWVLKMEWSFAVLSGSLAMALVWSTMALMMVGIETAGVALFSHMRGQGVPLAASSKVTAYASALMWPWVILGGVQLVWVIHWLWFPHVPPMSIYKQQIIIAGSIAAAHIGGLLHFELTVYRGVRAIQFANR